MKIGTREIGPHQPPYIIAELGVNHDGSADRALALIDAAHRAGADAIKLQCFRADLLLSRAAQLAAYQANAGASDPFSMLQSLELDVESMARIIAHAHASGLHALVTIFSLDLVELAGALPWNGYKVASPDLVHRPLIEALAALRLPLIFSTGTATADEVVRTRGWLKNQDNIAFMQCVSAYPAPDERASLGGIAALGSLTGRPVGYSDHTTSVDTGALAIAAGACMLEKHLTYDRRASGPDHAASLDPNQFAEYARQARRAWTMRGEVAKRVLDVEADVRHVSRQSIVARRALRQGTALQREHVTFKRPGTGLEPWRLDEIIGRCLANPVEADMPISESDLA